MKKILALIICASLAACANMRPENATDYDSHLQYPDETKNFVMINKKLFDEPMLGIMLEYTNKQYPQDNIDLYIYPIASYDWSNTEQTLKGEMQRVLGEVDQAIEYGYYKARSPEVTEPYSFSQDGIEYSGLKSSFELTDKNGITHYSNAYLFLEQDKYLKFRTSFNSVDTVPWNGDTAVGELLPVIKVPGESKYLAGLRAEHKKRVTQNIVNLLLQAAQEESENEKQ